MPLKLEIDCHSDGILFAIHYFYFCAFFAVLELRYELAKPEQLGELVDEAEHLQQVLQPQAEGVEPPEDVLLTERGGQGETSAPALILYQDLQCPHCLYQFMIVYNFL